MVLVVVFDLLTYPLLADGCSKLPSPCIVEYIEHNIFHRILFVLPCLFIYDFVMDIFIYLKC